MFLVLTAYLVSRHTALVRGDSVPADIVVFLVWMALLLVPLFQEIELFGLRFKQQVEKAKEELRAEIHSVRAELRNAVDVRTNQTFSPQITLPAPAPDWQLPDIEVMVRTAMRDTLAAHGITQPPPVARGVPPVDDNLAFLFATRYGLEKELRRLAADRGLVRRASVVQLLRMLVDAGVMGESLANAVREVYAVTTPAIHGEEVTGAQVDFVRQVGPQLINSLAALGRTRNIQAE